MERAKAAVSEFLHKDGHHHTTVHEKVNPAVQHEHVTNTHHENVTTAIDREVHQDHHHTTVQPLHDREILPEKHTHNVAGVQEREIHHGDKSRIRDHVEAERAQFKNTRDVGATQHTQSTAPTVAGEHVHHHVHETIQPVIEKETIQPSVVHTTVPIHEVHHNEAKHHTASTLPAMSVKEFTKSGGVLSGRHDRVDSFDGAPRDITKTLGGNGVIGGHGAKGDTHLTGREGKTHHGTTAGLAGAGAAAGVAGARSRGNRSRSSSLSSSDEERAGKVHGTKKPGLMAKLNPKIDADGDGKAGLMD